MDSSSVEQVHVQVQAVWHPIIAHVALPMLAPARQQCMDHNEPTILWNAVFLWCEEELSVKLDGQSDVLQHTEATS